MSLEYHVIDVTIFFPMNLSGLQVSKVPSGSLSFFGTSLYYY